MSTNPNTTNNNANMSDNNKIVHPPKKRSLSSYLSKLSARKEELEKLKHTDDNIVEPSTVETDPLPIKQDEKTYTKHEPVNIVTNNTESTTTATTNTTITTESTTIESKPEPVPIISNNSKPIDIKPNETSKNDEMKPIETTISSIQSKPVVKPLSEKIESNEILKENIIDLVHENRKKIERANELASQTAPIEAENTHNLSPEEAQMNTEEQRQQQVELESKDNSHLTTFSRDELKSVLKDPTNLASSPQKVIPDTFELSKHEDQKNNKKNESESRQQEDVNEMIDSDAETPKGSPIKVKKGRLIRGDKLQHLSSVLNSATFNNDSDSELSDVNDSKDVNITSSFLNENSNKNNKPNTNKLKENKQSSPLKKAIKRNLANNHIAISKGPKNKKSVYRDAGGRTRLQIACDKGKIDVVKKLLDDATNNPNSNVDINDQDNAGNTPLHEAALNGHIDIVELLLDHGANVNIQSYEYFQDTPLIDASANGHLDVVEFLLTKGADPTITNARGLTAYEAIDEEDSELDEEEKNLVREIKKTLRKGTQSWTNTHYDSTKTHEIHESRELKRQNSNNHDQDNNNNHYNYNYNNNDSNQADNSMEKTNVIEFYWTDLTSKAGKDKLMQAAKEGYLAYVGQYLENGGRIDFKSFLESVRFGHEDIASLFLAFGAQVNKLNRDDYTPLMVAVGRGHFGTVKLLLEAGADPTIKNKKGHTALYYARNSPVGVIDDEEIKLLIKSIKSHGGSIEAEEEEEQEENQPQEDETEEHKMEKVKSTKEQAAVKSSESTESISNITKENKSLERTSPSAVTAAITSTTSSTKAKSIEMTKLESMFEDDNTIEATKFDDIDLKKETPSIEPEIKEKNGDRRTRDENEEEEDDDEEPVIPTSKYKHNSPSFVSIPRKRSNSIVNEESSQINESENIIINNNIISPSPSVTPIPSSSVTLQHEDKKPKVEHIETEKERQERLKSEEEYLQRKIQNKRRKELELIQKLQEDEKKRVEEKERVKLEEAKRLELLFKAKEMELEKKEKEIEIEKRRRIRSMYPLGLKLIKFNGEPDLSLLPLYYIIKDNGIKYVLDLQLLVILKKNEMISTSDSIPIVESNDKLQLWNIHRQIFLFGGDNSNEYTKIYNETSSLTQRLQFENEEYEKFVKLPMNWIKWESVLPTISDLEVRDKLQSNMVELSCDNKMIKTSPSRTHSIKKPHRHNHHPGNITTLILPIRLQHRPQVVRLLRHERLTESEPLW